MGLNAGDVISASEFTELKARIKAECARRKYNGSVASYAGTSYDYTVAPTTGNAPLPEHFNKIIVPLNAIINTGMSQEESGDIVYQMSTISSSLATLESISATAASSGCKASCTGLCQGTCASACTTGCTGGCKGTCKGTCSGGCTSCTGSCVNGCSGLCTQLCYDNCYTECYGECAFNCTGTCQGGCLGGCKNDCKGFCKGGVTNDPA